jgi:hypothetical protein
VLKGRKARGVGCGIVPVVCWWHTLPPRSPHTHAYTHTTHHTRNHSLTTPQLVHCLLPPHNTQLHGDMDTMNMNRLLLTNIKSALYFRELRSKTTYAEVVDEIYYQVRCTHTTYAHTSSTTKEVTTGSPLPLHRVDMHCSQWEGHGLYSF